MAKVQISDIEVVDGIVTKGYATVTFELSNGDLSGEHTIGPFNVDLVTATVRSLAGDALATGVIRLQNPLRKDNKNGLTADQKVRAFKEKAAKGLTWADMSSGISYAWTPPSTAEGFAELFGKLSPEEQAKFMEKYQK